ncbi:31 kDa ribonucleoprotein, chloroplastic-like [Iris pallida]|uniref:31 kDa ribonucleoprotein, chloroplastic-like n=1 Tax=Iris pallida TaxID=29817 RepID=A0AAX6I9J2_IRIPA|nr:31 kDa ribonucleoprotein, chloroplastic-like [Iris pallida]
MASATATAASFLFSSKSNPNPKLGIPHFTPKRFSTSQFVPSPLLSLRRLRAPLSPFLTCSAAQPIAVEEEEQQEQTLERGGGGDENQRKLYVANLPWSLSARDLEKLFGECGTVGEVEIIKKDGKSRGFAFVTMSSGEEAQAAVDKFSSYELMGRIIKVEFAKSFKKPSPPPPSGASVVEERHKIYASNLAWKVRATDLRTFFSDKFKPVSARVVFDNPTGRSTGYGFVGFATSEEAEAAIYELDGKELMGRPLRLNISEKKGEESGDGPENTEQQQEES